jgi:hypothetical protein
MKLSLRTTPLFKNYSILEELRWCWVDSWGIYKILVYEEIGKGTSVDKREVRHGVLEQRSYSIYGLKGYASYQEWRREKQEIKKSEFNVSLRKDCLEPYFERPWVPY